MKALMAVLFGVLLLVSCGIVASSNIIPQGRYRITREMCLTREAYYKSDYPCELSPLHGDGQIERVSNS